MGNPYFKTTYNEGNNEATLYKNASSEICEAFGVDMYYLPRTLVNPDHLFGEDTISAFNTNTPITFFIENYTTYDGLGDMFSKFGYTADDSLSLIVGREHFDIENGQEPIIGDLIFYPAGKAIFEVVFVEDEEGFMQLNHRDYVYKIKCKLFETSYEDFTTGINDIDSIQDSSMINSNEGNLITDEITEFINLEESDIFGNL